MTPRNLGESPRTRKALRNRVSKPRCGQQNRRTKSCFWWTIISSVAIGHFVSGHRRTTVKGLCGGVCVCVLHVTANFLVFGEDYFSFESISFNFFLTAMTSKGRKEWKKMKVQELRDELSRRGLDVGGLRPALIERLEKSSNPPGNAGDEPGGPGLTEIPPPSEDGREIISAGNGEVPLAKVDEPEIAVNAEKAGDSKDTVPMKEPAVPVTAVEKPSSGGKDDGVANACGPLSDLEKKHRRAERFGLALHLSEEEKRKSRAARFGESPNGTPKANYPGGELKTSEEERRKARAERFGLSPRSYADDEAKKKARLARFGIDVKSDSLEEDKRKARATRFASVLDSRTSEVNKKIKPELAGTVAST